MPMIPFNLPTLVGRELEYIREVIENEHASGNGTFTQRCQAFLQERIGGGPALLTTSCTSALEMAAILANLSPGDEVILPSYAFTSTANAFVLRGAVPVFVDIRPDTLNLDERLIEGAITPRTRAICVVHYAGVGCEMDEILEIASRHSLVVIEDAAQALGATYRGRQLGSFGQLSAFSFHETKNLIAGEGGALVVNDPALVGRAEIIWEKGTDRVKFKRGEIGKYTWVDIGSSFLPSEITAAFLWAQLEAIDTIATKRKHLWNGYHERLAALEAKGLLTRPTVPPHCEQNGHLYYVLLPSESARNHTLELLAESGVDAVFHYVPLHSAPAGLRYGRVGSVMDVTDSVAARLVRLPLHLQLTAQQQDDVVAALARALG
jgi:dTDP-4-amino-4,6-dideoxygalactose transaminase